MAGAFKKDLKTKEWMIDTKVKIGSDYKHFTKRGYPTLSAAKADFENAKEKFISNNSGIYESLLFEDVIERYKAYRGLQVRGTTLISDNSNYNKYMLPYFKGKLIKNVFKQDVLVEWHKTITELDCSSEKKNKVISTMKDLLKYCYNNLLIDPQTYQLCDVNLIKVKEGSGSNKKERVIWSVEEEERFINATKVDEIDNLMFELFILCATRIGEFVGLQVKNFDYEKKILNISQQIQYYSGEGFVLTNQLKSSESYRNIVITSELSERLNRYIKKYKLTNEDFIFHSVSSNRLPLSKTTFRRKLYHYCEVANVPKIVPHAIRHNMAVKLASHCQTTEDIEIAASRLGHTPSVFLDIYAKHKSEEKQASLMERILFTK